MLGGISGIGGECFSWMGGATSAVTRLLLIWMPGMPAVTRRARASGPGTALWPCRVPRIASYLLICPRTAAQWIY